MKVLLIKPPSINFKGAIKKIIPPLGLAQLASCIKDVCEVEILDATLEGYDNEREFTKELMIYGLTYKEIEKRITQFKPDVVGIHLSLSIYERTAVEVSKTVRKVNPDIITVLGGVHATFCANQLIEYADFIIKGEGDISFKELILNSSKEKIIEGKSVENLDSLPLPAYDLLDMDKYLSINLPHNHFAKSERAATIMTSRGCPQHCIFCSASNFFGHKVRCRSVENIKEEIDYLIKNHNIKEVQFIDDNLTYNKKRAYKIFDLMKSYNLPWCTPNGVSISKVDIPMVKAMKDSGCYRITYAIESGSNKIANKIIKKGIDIERAKRIIKETKPHLDVHCFFMIGLPGETYSDMEETFKFIKDTQPNSVSISIAMPLPGTELLEICKKNNYISSDFTFDMMFEHGGNISTPDFQGKDLEKMLHKKNRELNEFLVRMNKDNFKKYEDFAKIHKKIKVKKLYDKV